RLDDGAGRLAGRLAAPRRSQHVLRLGARRRSLQRVALLLDDDDARLAPAAGRGDRSGRAGAGGAARNAQRAYLHATLVAVDLGLDLLPLEEPCDIGGGEDLGLDRHVLGDAGEAEAARAARRIEPGDDAAQAAGRRRLERGRRARSADRLAATYQLWH